MKKQCSFLIVCLTLLVTACRPPQVVFKPVEVEKIVTIRDTITVAAPVPATSHTGTAIFPEESPVDIFRVEDETSFAEVVMTNDTITKQRKYRVTHGRKADTVYLEQIIVLRDTINIECPPTLPALPTNGKFPWWYVLAAMGALLVWWTGKRKKK